MARELKALVIDDDRLSRNLLTEILTVKGVQVRAFTDPGSYRTLNPNEYCHTETPCFDFILTDNQMPGMTGLEFIKWIKEMGCKIPNHHQAIISGDWDAVERREALALGVRVFDKPCPVAQIHEWIENISRESR